MSIKLGAPELADVRPRLTVVGIGGAGCNAINNMMEAGLDGVTFIAANTDAQSLAASHAEHRIQLGVKLTEGLGAGSKPDVGEAAAEEAVDEIRHHLAGSHMVFIAAGMGGGTGTGAASVVARVAKELGILTVGVVTKPFLFEGARRMRVADTGVVELKSYVDTLIVIPNQNLFRLASDKTTFAEAFLMADDVLYASIACIVDLIVKEGLINLDFADVRTIMTGMGTAVMGQGEASGERRAARAAEEALSNPLLDDMSLRGAKGLLLSITGGANLTLYEVDEAASRVRQDVDPEANIIVGATFDADLDDKIRVSIVASGMERVVEAAPPPPVEAALAHEPATTHAGSGQGEIHRRLTEALQAQAPEPQPQAMHHLPPYGVGPGTWQAPGNVLITEGLPQFSPSAAGPPPIPHTAAALGSQSSSHGFSPAPAAEVRRPLRRMPDVEDFPPIGQRAYRALAGSPQASAPEASPAAEESDTPRRQTLFERITSRIRRRSEQATQDEVRTRHDRDASSAFPFESYDGSRDSSGQVEQEPELPVFFSKNRG